MPTLKDMNVKLTLSVMVRTFYFQVSWSISNKQGSTQAIRWQYIHRKILLDQSVKDQIEDATKKLAAALKCIGIMNIQFIV